MDATYDLTALVETYLDARRHRRAHPDLRDYDARRFGAMAAAFGIPTEPALAPDVAAATRARPPVSLLLDDAALEEAWRDEPLAGLFLHGVRAVEGITSPFACYLEAPNEVSDLCQRHGRLIAAAIGGARDSVARLLADIISRIWGVPQDRRINDDDLVHAGFDPRQHRPDPLDYL
jgi:hypothetical protein